MAYVYADYLTLSGLARRDRLALHIQEVVQATSAGRADVSADGKSVSRASTNEYLRQLREDFAELEKQLGLTGGQATTAGGLSYVQIRNPR